MCYFPFNFKIILKIRIDEYVISTDLANYFTVYFFRPNDKKAQSSLQLKLKNYTITEQCEFIDNKNLRLQIFPDVKI